MLLFIRLCFKIIGKPTEVSLDIYVESFGNIKEVNMVGNTLFFTFFWMMRHSQLSYHISVKKRFLLLENI